MVGGEPTTPCGPATVAGSTEAAVIALLTSGVDTVPGAVVGQGDDATVLEPGPARIVTTDMLVEGTHFRTDYTDWRSVGRRAVAQNVSDVVAMGGRCRHLLVAVCLRPDLTLDDVRALADGLHTEAGRYGAVIAGGDVTSGPVAVVTVTAVGELAAGEDPIRLDGGRPGDVVALSGSPGRSAAGLDLLLSGHLRGPLQDAHRVPDVPVDLGSVARSGGATALTDVTDGLLRDLSGLARAGGCAASIESTLLVRDARLDAAARLLGASIPTEVDARVGAWILDGGEDHGLLATFPPDSAIPGGFTAIGRLVEGEPGAVSVDGAPRTPGGWDSARGAS